MRSNRMLKVDLQLLGKWTHFTVPVVVNAARKDVEDDVEITL